MGAIVCSLVTVQGIVLRTSSAISFDHHKKGPEEGLSCDLLDGAVLGDWSQHRAGYQRGCTASCVRGLLTVHTWMPQTFLRSQCICQSWSRSAVQVQAAEECAFCALGRGGKLETGVS